MAKTYTAPTTVAAGDALTASLYNTYVGTNVANLIVPPLLRLERGTTQSIANATDTFITWPTEVFDTDGMYTATSDTITAQTAGIYQVNVCMTFDSNGTGVRVLSLCKNTVLATDGTKRIASVTQSSLTNGAQGILCCSTIIELAATDTIKAHVYQTSGGALNIGTAGSPLQTSISMAWLGRTS